jgi:acyl dehydratase
MTTGRVTRRLTLDEDVIRAYSRRGNYHSDASTAAAVGLPGLLAQGVHVAGPAYGTLLDAWGAEFLERGELDLRFVSPVYAGETVEATVTIDDTDDTATLEVTNVDDGRVTVAGTATRASRD